jgi:hypothetical protein
MGHKDYKTINRWLRDLRQKGYIERIFGNSFEERTRPAIYFLARQTKNHELNRCLIVADLVCKFAAEAASEELTFRYETSQDLAERPDHKMLYDAGIDLGISWSKDNMHDSFAVLAFDKANSRRSWQRLRKCIDPVRHRHWESESGTSFPKLAIIHPDEVSLRLPEMQESDSRGRIWFETLESIRIMGV